MRKFNVCICSVFVVTVLFVSSTVPAISATNSFTKVEEINIGADIDWQIDDTAVSKAVLIDSDEGYRLSIGMRQLTFQIDSSSDAGIQAKRYVHLAIEDFAVDGERLPLFQWCLDNQSGHDRYLQQGLSVKDNVCLNQGGSFTIQLNRTALEKIENAKRLSFIISLNDTLTTINYDISDFKQAIAIQQAQQGAIENTDVTVSAIGLPTVNTTQSVEIKPAEVRLCTAKAPKDYTSIAAIEYVCDDKSDKARAENKIASAVAKEDKRRQNIAAEKERRRLAAIAAKKAADKKAEQERQKAEQAKQAEEQAIAASQKKHQQVMDELTEKMVDVCNKIWVKGKHRCYCEKFIQYAPEGIESDSSCSGQAKL